MNPVREGRYATRWVRRGGHYALERTLQREAPSPVAYRPGVPRPACPLQMILYATFAPFVFGLAGWLYLAYLLR
jgi:hypothetical protein